MSATRKLKRLRWTEPRERCSGCLGHLKRSGDEGRYCTNVACDFYLLREALRLDQSEPTRDPQETK